MSYIPDCRNDENYNEKFLNLGDSNFVAGFDWAIEEAMDSFFDNHFQEGLDDDSYIGNLMCTELPESLKESYEAEFRFGRGEESRAVETVADYIRARLLDWVESCRNELIVSMIDSMDEEELEKNKSERD